MLQENAIWMGVGAEPDSKHVSLLLNQANRHGLIAGASGTGKTVTLKVMAEGFARAGVPVFMADVKGDITGMCEPGTDSEDMQERIARFGIEGWSYAGCPVRLWDMLGEQGIPVRITVSDMGPTMLARLLELTEVQEGVLDIVFRIADDKQLLLIDLKDLRSMLNYAAEHAREYESTYGKVSSQSVGAILRSLISIEDQGGDVFFGEPALDLADWFACAPNGEGYVNILNAAKLIQSPKIYAMFLLWMLSELFDTLPEAGDLDKPKFVFFFDEAHLLFNDMPSELLDKIVQVVKLIRSKGVGVYFITQGPSDIPDEVLAQLSNRIQHGLRAYTPAEQKAVRAAASSFRANPAFKSEDAILELGTGEALVSFLNADGQPEIVERAKILPPQCLMAAASGEALREACADQGDLMAKYGTALDRESAFEQLEEAARDEADADRLAAEREALEKEKAAFEAKKAKEAERAERAREKQQERMIKGIGKLAKQILGTFGREATRQITRNLFGGCRR
ncbi:ATP-binding protein [Collinsella sp. An271]|uniref:helicase HerA-like domain-containing protein n=1 Tax=Collinsella sp. An271 TaxID=1965616 RepID=UPI000B3AFA4C|nr:helicase HerA-like domain-containing protein [Collinsella sp. An271]OUO59639.1 ATP-binding protein [Collinsella sp. An271]